MKTQAVEPLLTCLLRGITQRLRSGKFKESYYKTSQESGIRIETVKQLENAALLNFPLPGNAETVNKYLQSFAIRYPGTMAALLYNLQITLTSTIKE